MRANARLMGRAEPEPRPILPSITTVYRPVEEFWDAHWPREETSPRQQARPGLSPLDALLLHLVIDLMPEVPTLVDLAAEATQAAATLVGLTHPRIRRVVTATSGQGLAAEALQSYARDPSGAWWGRVPEADPSVLQDDRSPAVVVMDVRGTFAPEIARATRTWLESRPDTLVVLLGMGKLGRCPALGLLWPPEPDRECGLVRELGEVLAASTMALVSSRSSSLAGEVLGRLQALFAGNFGVLDLLRTVNHSALRAARIDAETMKSHVWSWAVTSEMDQLRSEATALRQKTAEAAVEVERLLRTIWECRQETAAAIASRDEALRHVEVLRHQAQMPSPSPQGMGRFLRAATGRLGLPAK